MSHGKKVLVVEDDELVSAIAISMLERLGCVVYIAIDGPSALEIMGRVEPDILFTDITLPGGMDGLALAKAAQARQPGLRTIYVSGDIAATIPPEGLGPYERALGKPYRKADLQRVLGELLE